METTPQRSGTRLAPATLGSSTQAKKSWEEVAVDRLRFVCGIGLVVGLAALPLLLLRQDNLGVRAGTDRPGALLPIWLLMTAGLLAGLRTHALTAGRKLDLGLVYLVVSCFAVALFRHWLPYAPGDVVRGASPVALTLLFFAAMVPIEPRRMMVAAGFAVLADLFALAATVAILDNPMPPWNQWLWLHAPDVFTAPVAVMTSLFLYRLNTQVEEARAMGSYQLIKKLGAGGMGEVWLAEHRTLARPAAIKVIRTASLEGAAPDKTQRAVERFEREAQATAALTSPHTIRVFDFGTASDGSFYYVMELLDGVDLDELVSAHGALPSERVVYLLLQACNSLREAHGAGIVHRDIKPANLFLCRIGLQYDFVKVLDFGLVKIESDALDVKLTADDAIMGSPGYMAPEMIRAGEVDARADIYALGCVAYHLLSGRMVFEGDSAIGVMMAHVQDEPVPLSEAATQPIPGALESLVMRCLAKSPAARPATIAAVTAELEATGLAKAWSSARAKAWWDDRTPSTAGASSADDPTLDAAELQTATLELGETVAPEEGKA